MAGQMSMFTIYNVFKKKEITILYSRKDSYKVSVNYYEILTLELIK